LDSLLASLVASIAGEGDPPGAGPVLGTFLPAVGQGDYVVDGQVVDAGGLGGERGPDVGVGELAIEHQALVAGQHLHVGEIAAQDAFPGGAAVGSGAQPDPKLSRL